MSKLSDRSSGAYGRWHKLLTLLVTGILPGIFIVGSLTFAGESGSNDAGSTLIHHIGDKHSWQIVPFTRPLILDDLRIGSVRIPISQHTVMLWLSAAMLITLFSTAFHRVRLVPSKLSSILEPVIVFVRDAIVFPSMGPEMGKAWLPFFYTLFSFILCTNLMGLIPLFSTITGNINVTGALAVMILFLIITNGVKKNGFFGFFKNMVPAGVPLPIGIFLIVIEIPGLIIRSGVLAIRLFANMIAGHFVIYSLLLLIFIIHPVAAAISVPMAVFISLLEILVAFIQAVVFTMLSSIFIKMASSHH